MEEVNIKQRTLGVNLGSKHTEVSCWAPLKKKISIVFADKRKSIPLKKDSFGFWKANIRGLHGGDKYKFKIDDEQEYPDPASLSQPEGVHGYSMVTDLSSYQWRDQKWTNHPLRGYIIYELHVGAFTPEGTFVAVIDRLDYLIELGITAIEIMPIAQFPGDRNWGYDGVFPFAVQHSYGGAHHFQQLVDACHQKGLAVILDVVFNHLGPEGNYLGAYGPYFTEKYQTPWGAAVNLDDAYCDGMRQFIIENMLMWFRDFHVDALRLDAVHAMKDFSSKPILRQMRLILDQLSKYTKRPYYLIAECDLNDPKYIRSTEKGGYGMHAQWVDEFHHALRVSVGEPAKGYYTDFKGVTDLAKSYRDAYVFDGQYSGHRHKYFGDRVTANKGEQFVVFSQNHDQVGNRMLGERSAKLYSFELQKLLLGAILVSPYMPMLFMGEEYGETNPFLYFVSHTEKKLARAVREGRRKEFKDFHGSAEAPDPNLLNTFERSKLQWSLLAKKRHRLLHNYYKVFIAFRKTNQILRKPDRKRFQVSGLEKEKVLVLLREDRSHRIAAILNFDTKSHVITLEQGQEPWKKLIGSSDEEWGGKCNMPNELSTSTLTVPSSSISVYRSKKL
ncbi:malto-oligosyltrehalose trehalohydrolase [Olivibacter sp. SDN3]|nr:malto-oligosyltrehalose trehalohydrolase [Olivibacter sp. SDN3]